MDQDENRSTSPTELDMATSASTSTESLHSRLDTINNIEQTILSLLEQLVAFRANTKYPAQIVLRLPLHPTGQNKPRNSLSQPLLSSQNANNRTVEHAFAVKLRVLSIIHTLLCTGVICSKRDVFYMDPSLFGSQVRSNAVVESFARVFDVPRDHLNIVASAKGLILGDISFDFIDESSYDCSPNPQSAADHGHLILPEWIQQLKEMHAAPNLKFILVVEKDAVFNALAHENFQRAFGPCIVLTGKGFPDLATRALLAAIHNRFPDVPVLILVDFDPSGLHILLNFLQEHPTMSTTNVIANIHHQEQTKLDPGNVFWLGLHANDVSNLSKGPLTERDQTMLKSLLDGPALQRRPRWRQQAVCMLESGGKAEIEAVYSKNHQLSPFIYHKLQNSALWL